MKNCKMIWGFLVMVVLMFVPYMVKAESTDSYVYYYDIETDGKQCNSYSYSDGAIELVMNNASKYSFSIMGYNLEEDESYVLELTSDFINYSKKYTGRELMNGIDIERNDGNSIIHSRIYLEKNSIDLKSKVRVSETFGTSLELYDEVYFRFNNNFDFSKIDAYYNKITSNGKIKINSIKPEDENFMETAISTALRKYNTDEFHVFGYCSGGECFLSISELNINNHYKEYNVEYIFEEKNEDVFKKVNTYVEKFTNDSDTSIENTLYRLDDLENINYKYTLIKNDRNNINVLNSIINYSSEIHKMLDYTNLTLALDTRAGWDEMFSMGGFGFLNILYDGIIYGVVDRVGIKQVNVIYISDTTEDTTDAYIKAALKRVQEYLPNAKVSLKYAGEISDIDQTNWILTIDQLIDESKTLGEYYTLTIDGNDFNFFIEKDSSKMKNPQMNTVDLVTNIKINGNSYQIPLDAKIYLDILNENSKEYKELIEKLELEKALIVDLNLFSNLTSNYITRIDNGKFKVYIPLTEEYKSRDLCVYYVKDDGTVEIHEVTVENGYAVFETDHFSTYTLGITAVKNPNTFDNVIMYVIGLVVSLIVVIAGSIKFKRSSLDKK